MGYPPIGRSTGAGQAISEAVAPTIFEKKDGTDAIFANTGARDAYFQANPDELARLEGHPVGIGTADAITAAYMYDIGPARWRPVAANFRGPQGVAGRAGAGIDPSKMKDGEIAKWSASENKLVNSGVKSEQDGSLSLEPSSMVLGSHIFQSSAENIVVTNKVTGKHYAPLWQEVGYGKKTGYIRAYQDEKSLTIGSDNSQDITNPVYQLTANADTTLIDTTLEFAQDATNVELRVYLGGDELWLARLGDVKAGQHKFTFTNPADFKKSNTYEARITSSDGSDVILKGGPRNVPASSIHYADWTDLIIATEDWVNSLKLVNSLSLSGSQLNVGKTDGTSESINLPAAGRSGGDGVFVKEFDADYDSVASEVDGKESFFIYTGRTDASFKLPDMDDITASSITLQNPTDYAVTVSIFDDEKIYPDNTSLRVPAKHTIMFLSDKANNRWHAVILEGTGSDYVSRISANLDGKSFVVYQADGTNTTITLDAYASEDEVKALQQAILLLQTQRSNRLRSMIYNGNTAPTYPLGTRGSYYITIAGLGGNLNITGPSNANASLPDGTIFFVDNDDPTYNVSIMPGNQVQTVGGKAFMTLEPNTVAWFIINGTDLKLLFKGYIPSTYKRLASEIKSTLLADDTFIRDIQIQGDDPNVTLDCTTLEFPDAKVVADPKDQLRGVVTFPKTGSAKTTFVNPDGSEVTTDKVKLVGMKIEDPGDGTPPKLLLLTDHGNPTPSTTSAYAFFSDSPTPPEQAPFKSLPVYRNGKVTVHKDTADPQYVYIILPPGEGDDVTKIGEYGGLPSFWAKSSKNYPNNNVPRVYTVFRSPYKFHESDITFILYP